MVLKDKFNSLFKALAIIETIAFTCAVGTCVLLTRGTVQSPFMLGMVMWLIVQPVVVIFTPIMTTYFTKKRDNLLYLVQEGFIDIIVNHCDGTWVVKSKEKINVEYDYGKFTLWYPDDPKSKIKIPERYITNIYPKSF